MGQPRNRNGNETFEEVPMLIALITYMGWGIVIIIGYVKEFLLSFIAKFVPSKNPELNREVIRLRFNWLLDFLIAIALFQGYAPLYSSFESFYTRNVYIPIRDCWNKPICSVPGAEVVLKDRITKDNGQTFEWVTLVIWFKTLFLSTSSIYIS